MCLQVCGCLVMTVLRNVWNDNKSVQVCIRSGEGRLCDDMCTDFQGVN